MRIDVHTHAFHPKIAQKVLAQLNDHYDITPVGAGVVEDLLPRIRRAGLDAAVVLTAATDASQVVPANNWAIDLKKQAQDVIPFGTLHPDYPDCERELKRLKAHGIRGLKFHADFQGFFLDDPAFLRVMEMVGDDFVLMFHVGDRLPPEKNPSCPLKLAALRKAFPGPAMIAAHMGGYLHWAESLEHLAGTDVYFDTSSTLPFIADDLLAALFSRHPFDRILFGSDYPLFDPGQELHDLKQRLGFSEERLDDLTRNAAALFA